MAFKCREEIVGKRFLSVKSQAKLKLAKISEWEWRSGVVRAVSSRDSSRSDLSALIEFDDSDWQQREWIRIHSVFQVFLVEQTVVWSERLDPENKSTSLEWPALNFRSIVDKVGLNSNKRRPIEFFDDHLLAFVEDKNLGCYQETEVLSNPLFEAYPSLGQAVKTWLDYQDGQKILLTTPTVLVGYRLEVYRAEGTTQWYTAVIQSYNHTTKTLSLTDDTVLEEHNEDPALIQMRLLDDGVVDSILRGVEVGIGPRRTRQTNKEQQAITTRNPTSKQPSSNTEKNSSVRNNKVKQKELSSKSTEQEPEREKPKAGKSVSAKDRKRKPADFSENSNDSTETSSSKSCRSVEKRVKSDSKSDKPDQSKAATDPSKSKSENKSVKKDSSSDSKIPKDKTTPKRSCKNSNPETQSKQCTKSRPSRLKKKDSPSCDSSSSHHEGVPGSPDISEDSGSVASSVCDNQSAGECPNTQETTSEEAIIEDNMHFMKQRLLASNSSSEKSPAPINANIDVNRSVTDQIAKLSRTESAGSIQEEGKSNSPNKSVSPKGSYLTSDVFTHEQGKELRNNNNISDNISGCNSLSNSLNHEDLRSSSRASEHSNSGLSEDRRPASRLDDLKSSQKNSPSSSPLIIDRSEPVNPYRDPELMRKNPVHSNVHGMLGSHKKPSYANVHTPIPSAATPTPSIPSTTSYPSHPIPNHVIPSLQYPPHHLTAALGAASLGLHPSLAQMDPNQLAALQHQQLASMQYQLLLNRGGYPANLTMPQLEHLWQKTYPSIPIPPQYLLPKNREDLLGHLFSKEREIIERERMERERMDRMEKERMERDRQLERERQERIERERVERDKMEREREQAIRERAEKERMEKERQERERKEREEWKRMEHEREQKKERERILKESADTLAAVDDHFARSLRKEEREQMMKRQQEIYPEMEKFYKQTYEHQKAYEQLQKSEMKMEKLPKSEAYKAGPPNSSVPSGSVKQEKPNFNLYGYQPFRLAYISPDQLHLHGLDKKEEKLNIDSSKQSLAHAANMASQMSSAPPPLIKDSHSSVIVNHRNKDVSTSPRPAHSHHSHHMSSQSPRQPKPAHTPSRHHGSPHQDQSIDLSSSSSSSSSGLQVSALSAFRSTESKHIGHRTQSPLRVASPHQLNTAVMHQPVNYHKGESKPRSSPHSKSPVSSAGSNVPYMSAAIAQPPVSLPPGSVDYSCSLIQQGLVPNPIYSQNSVNPAAEHHHGNSHGLLTTTQSMAPTSSHNTQSITGQQGVKRKPGKESSNRKRQKGDAGGSNSSVGGGVPVTTPQIMTNPSPYTTTNSQTSVTSSASSAVSMLLSSASTSIPTSGTSGFMDSFKSFVENAVQNAFYQDADLTDHKKTLAPPPPKQQKSNPTSQPTGEESNSLMRSNSNSNLIDTITRVANGQINDTDSDTLSAPSPPPHVSHPHSQGKAANHPKLKKAWLQRHSDEDKSEVKVEPGSPSTEADLSPKAEDKLKNCYVNLTNISPKKEPGTKSPVSAYKLPNGNLSGKDKDDESTTSASETESQQVSDSSQKRKVQTKKAQPSNKKSKADSDDNSPPPPNPPKKKPVKKKEGAKEGTKSVKGKENAEEEKPVKKENTNTTSGKKEKPKEAPKARPASPEPMEVDNPEVKKEKTEKSAESMAAAKTKKVKKPKEAPPKPESSTSPGSPPATPTPTVPTTHTQPAGSSSYNKPPVSLLKKTGESFLQDDSCSEVTPKLMKCRECKMTPTQRSKKLPNIFCRFYAFRRLRYSQRGFLMIDGFSELSDAINDDIDPWLPNIPVMEPKIDIDTAKYIVARVGDKFCELVQQERESKSLAGDEAKIAWKRAVTGVREMCDVCDTTLFNMHWVCHKCGFVVCLDCYKVRLRALQNDSSGEGEGEENDPYNGVQQEEQRDWLTCSANRQQHEPDKLMLTQIIPGDALWEVGKLIHDMKRKWNIPCKCSCAQSNSKLVQKNGLNQQYVQQAINHLSNNKSKKLMNGIAEDHKMFKGKKDSINGNIKYNPNSSSPLNLLADVASMDSETSRDRSESPFGKNIDKFGKSYNPITEPVSPCGGGSNAGDGDNEKKNPASCSTLRELLTKTAGKVKSENNNKKSKPKSSSSTLDDIIQSVVEKQLPRDENSQPIRLMHYIPRMGHSSMLTRDTPILVHNLTETSVMYPDVPHSWLCDGRLLRLHDPKHKGNFRIFQEQWKRGQPVIVSGVDKLLNRNLWHPTSFGKTFGKEKNDVVNTMSGVVIIGHPMSVFWEGFERLRDRLLDDDGEPMLLKLKDWPPGDDFSDLMPNHFDDLMQALPLPEYTHRHGKLNLASRLPDFLVRPDLGPKMYNAYGSAKYPSEGTTNLHLDVSDAVNCMVYVGIPSDGPGGKQVHINMAIKAIDDACCDTMTKKRVRETNEVPGALWHIYDAMDADKIRDFLNKVGKERGEEIEPHHDPIHDQSWYLDVELQNRLYKEYGVLGYTIVQCMGDAVFIPAGAPHQVKNLHSCIKVAEDFVSPEHLNHCFSLTQEFRLLSDTHTNHEDKLQVKNIMYHAVKDALAVLNNAEPEED